MASVLIDLLGDGISMIYSFYDPNIQKRSLGTFIILDMIQRTMRMDLPYLYLGFFVTGAPKMIYKGRFMPQERLTPEGWKLRTSA